MVHNQLTDSELKNYFRSGAQLYEPGPNGTRICMGWGKTRSELLEEGFEKAELEKYVKKGLLGKSMAQPGKRDPRQVQPRASDGGFVVVYFYKTDEELSKP